MGRIRVSFDEGPTTGNRTGIGLAVAETQLALVRQDVVKLLPYVLSSRAKVTPPSRRLPLPAALALRLWQRWSPPFDRVLGNPDVVHGTNYVVPPTRCPSLVSVYDCWFLDHDDLAHPNVRRAGRVLRRSVANGASVVASSAATAERVRAELDTDDVHVVHLGPPPVVGHDRTPSPPDPSTPPPGCSELTDVPFVVAIGTIERRKNLPTLVDAFARLAHEHPTVRLVLAGADGDDSSRVADAITRLPPDARTRVVRFGRVDEPTKDWLLRHADALAYPSLDEGFGFPLLEAQQRGTPVVASSAGSIPEIAGNGGLFSPPLDAEALAANLYWVVTSDSQSDKLIMRGRRNLERFSWEQTASQLTDLYQQLTERTR